MSTVTPRNIRVAAILFFINAAAWLLLGAVTLTRASQMSPTLQLILALFMAGNAALMAAAGLAVKKAGRRFLYFTLAILLANIILTFTDEVGLVDLITVVIDLAILVLLITSRNYYHPGPTGSDLAC